MKFHTGSIVCETEWVALSAIWSDGVKFLDRRCTKDKKSAVAYHYVSLSDTFVESPDAKRESRALSRRAVLGYQ